MRPLTRNQCIAILRRSLELPYDATAFNSAYAAAKGRRVQWREFATHLHRFGIRKGTRGARGWSRKECLEVLESKK